MAGLIRKIKVVLDQAARNELRESFKLAAKDSVTALNDAFKLHMTGLKTQLANGLISKDEFRKKAAEAGEAFNQGILSRMKELGSSGKLATDEYRRLGDQLKKVGQEGGKEVGKLSGAWNTFKGVLAGVGVSIGLMQIKNFIGDLISLGSSAGETASKFETTFGPATEQASAVVEELANKMGLSSAAGSDMLATIGAMTQGMGASKGASATFSAEILKLAGDLTSFNNVPIEESFAAIRSGLVGQYEPMRRFGVVLDQATVNERALAMTHKTSVESLTSLERAQAALNLMYQKSLVAVGDLDRTQDSFANTTRRMGAQWIDVKTNLGEALLKIIEGTGVVGWMGDALSTAAGWVVRNKDEMITWARDGLAVAWEVSGKLFATLRDGTKDLDDFWAALVKSNAGIEDTKFRLTDAQNVLKNTGTEFKRLNAVLELGGEMLNRLAFGMGAAFAGVAVAIIEKIADLDEALARFTSHIPGMASVSKSLEEEAARARSRVEHLKEFIAGQEQAIQNSYTRTKTLQLDLQTFAQHSNETLVEDTVGAAGEQKDAYTELSKHARETLTGTTEHGKEKVKELTTATKKGLDEVVRASSYWSVEQQATNEIVAKSYIGQVVPAILLGRDAIDEFTNRVHAGTDYFTDEHVPAILRGSKDIDDSLHQTAAAEEGVTEAFRGGEQYYTQQYTPAILQGHGKQQEAAKKTEATHVSAYERIKSVVSDVQAGVGGLIDVLGLGDTAVGKVANGFAQAAGKAVNFVGAIVSGNWIGALTQGLGLIGDIVSALFKGSKNPERLDTNEKLYAEAVGGSQASLDQLYALAGRKDKDTGWATTKARQDAWYWYLKALSDNPALNKSGENTLNLRDPGASDPVRGHTGGIVGAPGFGTPAPDVPMSVFANAPRFHRGGAVGSDPWADAPRFHRGGWIGPNERPIIAEVGEAILSRSAVAELGRLLGRGGSSSSSRSVQINGGVHIHVPAGADGKQMADAFVRELDQRLGSGLTTAQTRRGNST